jgi:hypothetical protein
MFYIVMIRTPIRSQVLVEWVAKLEEGRMGSGARFSGGVAA